MTMIYLDYAAATPVDTEVLASAQPYFADAFFNPSARYEPAKQVRRALDDSRGIVANWLGVRSEEIFFTAGGTEANNLAIAGVMDQYPQKRCVVSSLEHDSVFEPASQYDVSEVPATEAGLVDVAAIRQKIDDDTVLLSIIYANNEIGTVQPLRKIAAVVREIREKRKASGNTLPLYFHTDACQAPNYLDLHVNSLGVDMMTLNGGKIYGFKQSGCLFVSRQLRVVPIIRGGGQERNIRSGTESVVNAVGLAAALNKVQQNREKETRRMKQLQQQFIKLLASECPGAVINGSVKHRLPNNLHVTFPGMHNEILLLQLEGQGILAAAGSACSANNQEKPSRVMQAIGKADAEAQQSIRFSMGQATVDTDIDQTVQTLRRLLSKKQ